MKENNIKIVIDTNIWVSYLLTKSFRNLDDLILSDKVQLIVSDELMHEFINVVKRPKFDKLFDFNDIEILLNTLQRKSRLISVTSDLKICPDKKDNFLLNLSVDSNADYLITGDKDLLNLMKIDHTEIITIKRLFEILEISYK